MRRLLLTLALALSPFALRAEVAIQEITSPGGIDAWLVESPEIPFVALEIRIRGGSNLDEPGKRGATNLMMGLIEEGAGDMDAQTFQATRESLAADFGFRAYDDSISVSAQVLTENRDEAIDLLRLAITQPRFDADAIERVRAQVIAGIESDALDPQTIASDTFYAAAYPNHPYGSSLTGTLDSVAWGSSAFDSGGAPASRGQNSPLHGVADARCGRAGQALGTPVSELGSRPR